LVASVDGYCLLVPGHFDQAQEGQSGRELTEVGEAHVTKVSLGVLGDVGVEDPARNAQRFEDFTQAFPSEETKVGDVEIDAD
jgi:hypothetical protein